MKKLLYFLIITLLLPGCSKDECTTDTRTDLIDYGHIPRIYGTMPVEKDHAISTRGVAIVSKVWNKPMAEEFLTVKFLNGSDTYKTFIKETVKEWEKNAGVRFEFVNDNEDALIRIGFDYNRATSSWAITGTDHLLVEDKQDEPTINYVLWRRASNAVKRNDVLRTFGQVLGLELEHKHPMFYPAWFTDDKGEINEDYIREYWENELDEFIPWEDLKKIVLDPIAADERIESTQFYDQMSIMSWPFYERIAYNLHPLGYDDEPITELSDNDKSFIQKLYGQTLGDLYPPKRYFPLVEFDYSGTSVILTLTTTKNMAIIWDEEAKSASYIKANGAAVTKTLTYTYPDANNHHITISEFLGRNEEKPDYSTALQKFDLLSGNNASNFDFKLCNKQLKYIRIVGGTDFKSQNFNFTGFENLEELYLVQTKNSKLVVDNCPKLHSLGTSRYIWKPTIVSGPHTSSVSGPLVDSTYMSVVGPEVSWPDVGATSAWPRRAEAVYSLADDATGPGLTILNCGELRNLSLENVAIKSFDFNNLKNLEYVYISSTKYFIVGCHATNPAILGVGHALANAIATLPIKTTNNAGTIVVRQIESGINGPTSNYIPVNIILSYFNNINTNADILNWYVIWDSGCHPFNPGSWWNKY